MKGGTITLELSTRRIRRSVKIEQREARREVKLTEINGISELRFAVPSLLGRRRRCVPVRWCGVADDETAQRQTLLPSEASR